MKTFTHTSKNLLALCVAGFGLINAQITFTNSNSLLHSDAGVAGSNSGNRSGNAVAVVDVNNDGLDDILRLDNNRYVRIEYQQAGGTFTYQYIGDFGTSTSCWGMSSADVDHNGFKDVLFNGGSQARLMKLNNSGTGVLGSIIDLPNGNIFSQNGNFCDINNDGWEDIFMCNDVNESRLWVNDGSGNFPAEQGNTPYINFNVTPGSTAPNDESGNYGSVFTDFDNDGDVDLYIAHCRQGQPAGDLRRYDVLFENNGSNVYTSNAAAHGSIYSDTQDWTSSFGDIDNDGDFDLLLTGHEAGNTNRVMVNDGNGNFSLLTTVSFPANAYESQMIDFDNDGFLDIIMTGSSGQQRVHRNNGNSTFTQVPNATLGFTGTILSFGSGDLNHDGRIDLYASYGTGYNSPSGSTDDVYWRNTTSNANHFLVLDLRGTQSTDGALGARAFIYGPWGTQTREVRASESYGNLSSFQLHFGLGTATTIDSIRIYWPAGNTDLFINEPADQFITVTEQQCSLSGITASYSGSTTFCSGDSLQISAPTGAGYNYLWSTGETTQSIYASSTGNYSVVVSTSLTCSASSPSVAVTVDPVESVSITAGGPTTFCPGGSVTLTSSQATGNTWSSSETTQSIVVSTAGTYTTSYQGLCQSWPSNSIVVTLLDNSAPTTTDDNVIYPAVGTVTATGSDVSWYDMASGGTLLGTGGSYSPGVINTTTTYYAEDVHTYGGSTGNVGSTNISASTFSGTTINGFLKFDVLANCTLVSVECSTDVAGSRIIELRNSGGTVLQSIPVNIPTGSSVVNLNFNLTPGTNYQLGTNTANNNTVLGFASPQLVRDNSAAAFPYSLAGAINITTGNNGGSDVNAYYYFYNWVVDITPTDICTSVRTPATIFVTPGSGINNVEEVNLLVYPNPTTEFVNVQFTTPEAGEAMLSVVDMLGKKVYDVNLGVVNATVTKTINTATYAKGVYNVKLTINNKEYNTRVVVR
jgi:hypothetical protein